MSLISRRSAVVLAGAAATLTLAAPALAHVDVEAAPARALAANATITVNAESESRTAGISGVRIQLPAGLLPADFRLVSGPAGWRASGRQQVLEVRGPALPAGRDLRFSLRVRQLPATRQLVLKTVQSYTDGRRDSWIGVPAAGAAEPDFPAPVLALAAPAPGATPIPREAPTTTSAPPTTPAPISTPPSPTPISSPRAEPPTSDNTSAVWLFGGAGIGALLLGAAAVAARRRAGPPNGP